MYIYSIYIYIVDILYISYTHIGAHLYVYTYRYYIYIYCFRVVIEPVERFDRMQIADRCWTRSGGRGRAHTLTHAHRTTYTIRRVCARAKVVRMKDAS